MEDTRPRAALNGKEVNLAQLTEELGGVGLSASAKEVVAAEGAAVTQSALTAAVAAHTPNPDFGKPIEEVSLRDELASRLQQLDDNTKSKATWDALSATQRQENVRQGLQILVRVARFVDKQHLSED